MNFFDNRIKAPTTDGQATGTIIPSQAPTQISMPSKGFNLGERTGAAAAAKASVDISVEEFLLVVLLQHVNRDPSLVLNFRSPTMLSPGEQAFIEKLRTTDGATRTALLKEVFVERMISLSHPSENDEI